MQNGGITLPELSIVIPCYNEEAALPALLNALRQLCTTIVETARARAPVEIVLVDDGSCDATWPLIVTASQAGDQALQVRGLKLSRNHGHQHALLAGLEGARGVAVISMDADLQDDPQAALAMLDAWHNGAEIVYGQRATRHTDSAFKRLSAHGYYWLMARMGVRLVPDHADYRLMSRKALDILARFGETNLFLRGIVPQIGLASAIVRYDRPGRIAGESKYPLHKMLALALEGITSFSVRPLRFIAWSGLGIAVLSALHILWSLGLWLAGGTVRGWASLVMTVTFLGGMQLLALGIIGEYIGKIYIETKRRPRFIIDDRTGPGDNTGPMEDGHAGR